MSSLRDIKTTDRRFWEKVDKSGECWLWTASLSTKGYGQFWNGGRLVIAHRWSYERMVAPIPSGLEIDHLCRTHACVNPGHLEPVTGRENGRRGAGLIALNTQRTHCPRGHEYTGDNLHITTSGGRRCRKCNRIRSARDRAAAKSRARQEEPPA